jgi:RNA polymerase sigma factor (sigma-70 family)
MMLVRKESRQTKAISLDMEISISNGSAASKVRLYEVIPCPDEGPDDLAEQQIAILEMYNALHRLPEQYRSILCLQYGLRSSREMNQRCIAREFGVTPQHMSRKLRTALSRLRIIMES